MDKELFAVSEFDILPSVLKTIRRYDMLRPGEGVVVGVSGGIDSMALLHVLWRLQEPCQLNLHIAHLNHSIRGEAADGDAGFVEKIGRDLGIPAYIEQVDIPAQAERLGLTEEEAGRKARYGLYDRIADQVGATRIAVGHHGDDQAETVVMNLVRGAGLRGLAGMPPLRGRVIRPLFELQKWQLEAYCREQQIPWREDATNLSIAYRRNYIRWEIMPRLAQLNPGVLSRIMHTASTLREDWQLLESLAQEQYQRALVESTPQRVSLCLSRLVGLPVALRKRVVDFAYQEISGYGASLPGASLEQMEQLIAGEAGGKGLTLPEAIEVSLIDNVLIFSPRVKIHRGEGWSPRPLPLGSSTIIEELNVTIYTEILTTVLAWWEDATVLQPRDAWRQEGTWWVDMDYGSVEMPLLVRSRQPGDRLQPLGMEGSKKLQDLFVDEKIPKHLRDKVPCIVDGQGIVAVVGLHQAHRTRVTEATQRVLRVTVQRCT